MSTTSAPAPVVTCILVHWNNFPDTHACLISLAAQTYPNLRILVVDNASTDGSLALLRAAHPAITFLPNAQNEGFPKACNLAARHPLAAFADFLWLLNNDTIAPPDTAAKLAATAVAHSRAGIIGGVLYYLHAPSKIQAWGGGSINRWTGYSRHYTRPHRLGRRSYITFACALIRRAVFDQLHGLYEGAFMYFEDADFALRARRRGWQLAVAADTVILHKEGGSAKRRTPRADRMTTAAGLLFLTRHAPIPMLSRSLFLTARVVRRLFRRDLPALAAVLHGNRDARRTRRGSSR